MFCSVCSICFHFECVYRCIVPIRVRAIDFIENGQWHRDQESIYFEYGYECIAPIRVSAIDFIEDGQRHRDQKKIVVANLCPGGSMQKGTFLS